jgi:NAD(P)-dependent dehydrogenase (short-subunit alcohol dehydrogenase family)
VETEMSDDKTGPTAIHHTGNNAPVLSRRALLQAAAFAAATPVLTQVATAQSDDDFDASSTAEEVTAGLDLSGKTMLVTGCNSGIGFETMRVLALRGAHVLGTARNAEKAETACANVEGKATPLVMELTDYDSVLRCAESAARLGKPLDALICNAGLRIPRHEKVAGVEKHLAVNHLGHFVITNELLGQVQAADAGRVVIVSSRAHRSAPEGGIEFDNLSGDAGFDMDTAYGQSKLANGLFAMELARRLQGTSTTCNALHPGVIRTGIIDDAPAWQRIAADLLGWLFFKTLEQGAATTCYLAAHPALDGVSGRYFADCEEKEPTSLMTDAGLADRLWRVSEELAERWKNSPG